MVKKKDISIKNIDDKIKLSEILKVILLAYIIGVLSLSFVRLSVVEGRSMDNTLYDGERLLLNTRIYKNNDPEHGDIVVVDRKDLSVRYFIKRIIAVSGDILEIKDNIVYLNGTELKENYIKESMYTNDFKIVVPDGKVFVMGDNRNHSLDSRSNVIGLIDVKTELLGKSIYNISDFKKMD